MKTTKKKRRRKKSEKSENDVVSADGGVNGEPNVMNLSGNGNAVVEELPQQEVAVTNNDVIDENGKDKNERSELGNGGVNSTLKENADANSKEGVKSVTERNAKNEEITEDKKEEGLISDRKDGAAPKNIKLAECGEQYAENVAIEEGTKIKRTAWYSRAINKVVHSIRIIGSIFSSVWRNLTSWLHR